MVVVFFRTNRGKELHPRRLHASVPNLATKGPNENRVRIAFSIERNSGIDDGDLAEPAACAGFWQIGLAFLAGHLGQGFKSANAVERHPLPLAPEGGGNVFHSGGRQFASKRDPNRQALAACINGATPAAPRKQRSAARGPGASAC